MGGGGGGAQKGNFKTKAQGQGCGYFLLILVTTDYFVCLIYVQVLNSLHGKSI